MTFGSWVRRNPLYLRGTNRRIVESLSAWKGECDLHPLKASECRRAPTPISCTAAEFADVFASAPRNQRRTTLRLVDDELRYEVPERFVLELRGGHVAGCSGAVISRDGELLSFLSTGEEPTGRLPEPKRIGGRVAVLAGFAHRTFGHWMMETLPRISLLREGGYALGEFESFYVNADLDFQRSSLASAGIPLDRVVDCRTHPHVCADQLVVPSPLRDVAEASDLSCDYLRGLFNPEARGGSPPLVYVSRRQMQRRRIRNEDELLRAIEPLGFVSVQPEDMSFQEQAEVFAGADVIVGQLGSAVVNYVHCNPGAAIAEIQNRRLVQSCGLTIAGLRQLDYGMVYGSGVDPAQHPLNEDMTVDPGSVIDLLREFGIV